METAGRGEFDLWRPAECPLCAAGVPLDDRPRRHDVDRDPSASGGGQAGARARDRAVDSGWAVLGDPQITRGYCLLLPDPVVPI